MGDEQLYLNAKERERLATLRQALNQTARVQSRLRATIRKLHDRMRKRKSVARKELP